jgi:hypothetical protein
VKGIETPFGFNVDIAVNNENGILNIERHKNYFKAFPSLVPMLIFLKYLLFQNKLDAPCTGGIGSNTLIQKVISIIHSAPNLQMQMNAGKMLLGFLQCFGQKFNFVAPGITTRNGGRLFSRLGPCCLNTKTPVSLCIEDPQLPGSFLGENARQSRVFREKCDATYRTLKREMIGCEQSILGRVVQPQVLAVLITRRQEIQRHYQRLVGIESFGLRIQEPDRTQPRNEITQGVINVTPFAQNPSRT